MMQVWGFFHQLRRLYGSLIRQAQKGYIRLIQQVCPGCRVLSQILRKGQQLYVAAQGQPLVNLQALWCRRCRR